MLTFRWRIMTIERRCQMKNITRSRILQILVIFVLTIALIAGIAALPLAQASAFEASYIKKLDGVKVDYSDYLDKSVVQQLPQHIRDEETISVIIALDDATVMDAYELSGKVQSLQTFAADSAQAQSVRGAVSAQKQQMLQKQ